MGIFTLRDPNTVAYDVVTFGEVMMGFKPVGQVRVSEATHWTSWHGGGEANVSTGITNCFRGRAAHVTTFPDVPLAHNVRRQMRAGGVDTRYIKFVPYDGIGFDDRLGLNFTEPGFGLRGGVATADRGNTAASNIKPGDIDWDEIFGKAGARWCHTGGIASALSASMAEAVIECLKAARKHGVVTSFDLNYRESLWKRHGGAARAMEVNREIMPFVDALFGNEEDLTKALGYKVEGLGEKCTTVESDSFRRTIDVVRGDFPNLKVVATTLRLGKTASFNDWGAIIYADGEYYEASHRKDMQIEDRVGGGDSFCSGTIYGFLNDRTPLECVQLGAAHGALVSTTEGDTSMATLEEVEALASGKASTRIVR